MDNKYIEQFRQWHETNKNTTRLQKHEAMKSILFINGLSNNPLLEYKLPGYDGKRSGYVDYVDRENAIEIDDGPNIKSIKKLVYIRETAGLKTLWLLILDHGRGGRARRLAAENKIPLVIILARNNYFEVIFC